MLKKIDYLGEFGLVVVMKLDWPYGPTCWKKKKKVGAQLDLRVNIRAESIHTRTRWDIKKIQLEVFPGKDRAEGMPMHAVQLEVKRVGTLILLLRLSQHPPGGGGAPPPPCKILLFLSVSLV